MHRLLFLARELLAPQRKFIVVGYSQNVNCVLRSASIRQLWLRRALHKVADYAPGLPVHVPELGAMAVRHSMKAGRNTPPRPMENLRFQPENGDSSTRDPVCVTPTVRKCRGHRDLCREHHK